MRSEEWWKGRIIIWKRPNTHFYIGCSGFSNVPLAVTVISPLSYTLRFITSVSSSTNTTGRNDDVMIWLVSVVRVIDFQYKKYDALAV